MTDTFKQIGRSIDKADSEIERLNKIKNELETLFGYCKKLNDIGDVKISKTNIPHPQKNSGRIKFKVTVQTSTLDNEIQKLAKASYLSDKTITWVDECNTWQLTGTYSTKI